MDLISRQAAIDAVNAHYDDEYFNFYTVMDILKQLPSAQPDHIADDSKKASYSCGHENDLISRQAAIDALDGVKVDEENCTEYDIGYNDGIDFAVSRLSVLPSAQLDKLRWILCSKKLPELNRSVLVQLSDDFVDPIQIMTLNISKCEGDLFYFWKTQEMGINFEMGDVVAWMPLPTPWKGGQEQNHESTI